MSAQDPSGSEAQQLAQCRVDLQRLLDEVGELRGREAALLEIARAVAAMPNIRGKGGRSLCVACGRDANDHRSDCFREKARALLGLSASSGAR